VGKKGQQHQFGRTGFCFGTCAIIKHKGKLMPQAKQLPVKIDSQTCRNIVAHNTPSLFSQCIQSSLNMWDDQNLWNSALPQPPTLFINQGGPTQFSIAQKLFLCEGCLTPGGLLILTWHYLASLRTGNYWYQSIKKKTFFQNYGFSCRSRTLLVTPEWFGRRKGYAEWNVNIFWTFFECCLNAVWKLFERNANAIASSAQFYTRIFFHPALQKSVFGERTDNYQPRGFSGIWHEECVMLTSIISLKSESASKQCKNTWIQKVSFEPQSNFLNLESVVVWEARGSNKLHCSQHVLS
jgi:hypothetical protein